ncbi:MAG: choice-of-anchor A family protein, partial [Chlorobiota bacterium]
VLVNIYGDNAFWNGGLNVYGTPYTNVLYNFVEADSITISNIDVRGSILAPRTSVNFISGVQNGQMIAKNAYGTGQYNNVLFRGNIPVDTTIVNVAEVVGVVQNDPDSEPGNHLVGEDDIASVSIVIDKEINSTSGTNYNWQQVSTVGFNQIILSIITDQNGDLLAGTFGGGIYRSTNGGTDWTLINSNMLSVYIWNLITAPGGKIYAGTERGIYASTDNGNTWFLAGLSDGDVRALILDNSGRIFAGVWGRGVYYTDDQGASWTEFNTGLTDLAVHAFAKNSTGDIYVGTMGGGVHKLTLNSGGWFHLNSNPVSRFIWSLTVNGNGDVFAGTYGDGVIRSGDGGATWERISSGLTAAHIYAIGHDDNNNIFASAWGGGVYMLPSTVVSRFTGNWMNFGLTGKNISSIAVNSSTDQVIAGTESGDIYKTDIVNSVKDNSTLPTEFKLYQNYPNPFNPATVIEFALPSAQNVKLSVYNILGQEVKVLNDGPLTAGYHKFSFDGKNFASGVYFYRMTAGKFSEVKKMVLTK